MSKLIVPANREQAAKELKNNMVILKGCSDEVKEVIELAAKQKSLACWDFDGSRFTDSVEGNNVNVSYCLPDDCQIVVQDEKPVVPQWIADRFTVCEVREQTLSYKIMLPNDTFITPIGLPAALRCEGWVFAGWLHCCSKKPYALPFSYVTGDGVLHTTGNLDSIHYDESIAYASVWQKAGN